MRSAVGYGRDAVALFRQFERPQMEHRCLTYLALALPTTFFMGVDELQSRAWTLVAGGDLRRARGLFEEAAECGERIGDLVGAAGASTAWPDSVYGRHRGVRRGPTARSARLPARKRRVVQRDYLGRRVRRGDLGLLVSGGTAGPSSLSEPMIIDIM